GSGCPGLSAGRGYVRLPAWCRTARCPTIGQPAARRGRLRAALHPGAVDGKGVDDRTDVQPRGLAEVPCLTAVRSRDRDDQVVAVDDDLRTRDTEPVHAGADDLLRLRQ